jgi:hypothetical protein
MPFWEYLKQYPPALVRLCARRSVGAKHVVAVSAQEIAILSGLPVSRVVEVSQSLSWDDITLSEARKFCEACGFDPTVGLHRKRQAIYLLVCRKKRPNQPLQPPKYLRASPHWRTEFLPLIQSLRENAGAC